MSSTPDQESAAGKAGGDRKAAKESPRKDRLKVALKANMARRKEQARARAGSGKTKGQDD